MKVKQINEAIDTSLLEWKSPAIKRSVVDWLRTDKDAMDYLQSIGVHDNQWASWYENLVDTKSIDYSLYPMLQDVSKLVSKNNVVYTPFEAVRDIIDIKNKKAEKKRFSDEHRKEAEAGSKILYDDSKWIVRRINSYKASEYYGRGTRWCITGSKSWADETRDGQYFWDMHKNWGSILYFAESKDQKITYDVVDSESENRTDVRTLTSKLKVAIEIRPVGVFSRSGEKYEKAKFIFYDVLDKASYTAPDFPGFPDIYQIAIDAGDVKSIEGVSKEEDSKYPKIYIEDLDDAGISIIDCAFLDMDRARNLPKNILARGYNYLLDYAKFDSPDDADIEKEMKQAEETETKRSLSNAYRVNTGMVDEAVDKVSGGVHIVTRDGSVDHGLNNSLANDKQNYRTAIYTSGGLLTKLKNPKTNETFNQYDIINFAGDLWYIIDNEVLYQYNIVHFPRAALGDPHSLLAHPLNATVEYGRTLLRTTNIWRNMKDRFYMNLANFGHRTEDNGDNEIIYVMSEDLIEGYLNLNKPRFYDKKTNTLLCVNMKNKTYRTTPADEEKLDKTTYDAVDLSTIKTIVYILQDAGYSNKKTEKSEEIDETLKENLDMIVKKYNESYTDLDKSGAKDYKGETVYRITALIPVEDRIQMYVVGLGERDPEKVNYFEPVIRSARYTTEESFLFLSEEKAYEFLRALRRNNEQEEFNLKDFSVTEYHPFHEITKIIPIDSPLGRAFVGEQKIIKKKYDDKE